MHDDGNTHEVPWITYKFGDVGHSSTHVLFTWLRYVPDGHEFTHVLVLKSLYFDKLGQIVTHALTEERVSAKN